MKPVTIASIRAHGVRQLLVYRAIGRVTITASCRSTNSAQRSASLKDAGGRITSGLPSTGTVVASAETDFRPRCIAQQYQRQGDTLRRS